MRTLLPVLSSLIVVVGCSASHPAEDLDGGPTLDAPLTTVDAADTPDAPAPPPTPEDAHDCSAWASYACGRYADCYYEMIWIYGSLERCEDAVRADCEHEESLDGTGDLAAGRIACATWLADGCEWARDFAGCDRPSGTRAIGASCGSDLQCGEATTSDGRTVALRCFRDGSREPACDSGTCQLPLEEGAADCGTDSVDHDRCDDGLECRSDAPRSSYCAMIAPAQLDESCEGSGVLSDCEPGLVCGAEATCERARGNGESCDPDIIGHCAGLYVQQCHPTTRTCVPIVHADDGEPCARGIDGPSCAIASDCVDGICVPAPQFLPRGAACSADGECFSHLACVDGICAAEACD